MTRRTLIQRFRIVTDFGGLQPRDPDGNTRTFAYDDQGRITAENWYDAAGEQTDALRFAYNAKGELLSASNDEGAYTFAYDAKGRLIRETEPFGQWLTFHYSHGGTVVRMTDSAGGITISTYDDGQLVTRTLNAPGAGTIGVTLDDGLETTRTADGTVVGSTEYSADPTTGQVSAIIDVDAGGNVLAGFTYAYNAAGEVTSETDYGPSGPISTTGTSDPGATTNYTYDAAGQLVAAGATT